MYLNEYFVSLSQTYVRPIVKSLTYAMEQNPSSDADH
jgi:hypothetical protein